MLRRCLSVLVVGTILWASCEEREMGCLDPLATNFAVSADRDCCCAYPELEISIQHRFDSMVFQRDQIVDSTRELAIDDYIMVVSDFRFNSADGTTVGQLDSFWRFNTDCESGFPFSTRADILVSTSQSGRNLGRFVSPGIYSSLQFAVGLGPELAQLCEVRETNLVGAGSPVFIDSLEASRSGFLAISDSEGSLEYFLPADFLVDVQLTFEPELIVDRGEDVDLDIFLDYAVLLEGVHTQMSETEILDQLRHNFVSAFYFL